MQVIVGYKKPRYYHMRKHLKPYAKRLGRGSLRSMVLHAVKDPLTLPAIIEGVTKIINKELKTMCSRSFDSILREKSQAAMEHFSWESVWGELLQSAPVLMAIMQGSVARRKSMELPQMAKPVLCMCASMLLKFRNPQMCYLQCVVSLILHAGHAGTQVSIFTLNCIGDGIATVL